MTDETRELDFFVKVALFRNLGVNDPDDWRTVLLRLAERYETKMFECMVAFVNKRGPGSPLRWHRKELLRLALLVDTVKAASSKGAISHGIDNDKKACQFIVSRDPDARWIREALRMKPHTKATTLQNHLSRARAFERESRPDHENS